MMGFNWQLLDKPLVDGFKLSPRKAKRDGLSPISSLEYINVL